MSKLVDKERLAKLAKSLDSRAKAAVAAEKTRAEAAEQAAQSKADQAALDIAAINNEQSGILAKAKAYADGKDANINAKVDKTQYDAKMLLVDQKDADQDQDIKDLEAAVEQIKTQIGQGDLTGVDDKIDNAVESLEAADTALGNRIKVFEANGAKDVAALMNDVDALEEKVGHDVDGENPATGLFLEVDQAMAKANEVDQAVATEKTRAEGQEVAIRGEMATEAARVNQKIADDIAAESALRVAEEERIEGLVDAEVERAGAAEEALQGEIDAAEVRIAALEAKFNGGEGEGEESVDVKIAKVAQAVEDEQTRAEQEEERIVGLVEAEASRAAGVEADLNDAIKAEEARAKAAEKVNADAIADMKDATKEGSLAKQIANEVARAQGVESGLEARVAANEAKFVGLEKDTVQAAINQAEADAKAHAESKIAELVDSAPDAMNTLNELAAAINTNKGVYDAYIAEHAQAMAKQKEDLQKEIDDDIAAARTLISAEIDADVKAEADRAKGVEQDIRADFAAADTALHTTISAEIDADVKVEADRAKGVEADLQAAIDVLNGADTEVGSVAKAVKDAVGVENQRAVARENAIETAYKAADEELVGRISDLEDMMGLGGEEGEKSALEEIREDIAALEQEDKDLAAEDQRLAGEIAKKVAKSDYDVKVEALEGEDERIEGIAQGAQDAVDAVEGRMDTAEGEIDALQAFMNGHSHAAMEAQIAENKQGVADNKADIDVLNGAADVEGSVANSITEALKAYATEAEMLAVLGNVVNSLALSMEDNKMILKLGGVEGVAIHETSLDMATDADIDAIIAGLDA